MQGCCHACCQSVRIRLPFNTRRDATQKVKTINQKAFSEMEYERRHKEGAEMLQIEEWISFVAGLSFAL